MVVPAGNASASSGYQPGALLLSYETERNRDTLLNKSEISLAMASIRNQCFERFVETRFLLMKTPGLFCAFRMPRRSFLNVAAVTLSSFAGNLLPAQSAERKPPVGDGKLRIIVFGAHPDDC